jgi:FAD dependent oxidoreductase TIGR03364
MTAAGKPTTMHADVVVVGAGIVGLAQAWMAARSGKSVVLLERSPKAVGASIRNFGMIWPIGQPPGQLYEIALRSRELWLEAAAAAGVWVNRCGSLHVAFRQDELAVLEEFASQASVAGYQCSLLSAAGVVERSPAVRRDGLLGGLWSPTELCVDPRQAIRVLPRWLAEAFGVSVHFETTVRRIEMPRVEAADGREWTAKRVIVCGGADFETLFPETFAGQNLRRCKLQMLATVPQPNHWRIGPHLAGGLTLRHYTAFETCASLAKLKQRIADETPELDRYGIHVMASQNELGEVILGDSHEYDADVNAFDKPEIDRLILEQLEKMITLKNWTIARRWHGIYAKNPSGPVFLAEPQPGITVCTATGGAGMTMSFGLAERMWRSGSLEISDFDGTSVATK